MTEFKEDINNIAYEESQRLPELWKCVVLDAIGCISYAFPLFETLDLAWAPVSAFLFKSMFGGRFGTIGAVVSCLEEALPYTDIIPTFTICYFIKKSELKKMKG